jgi:hypothetical protein
MSFACASSISWISVVLKSVFWPARSSTTLRIALPQRTQVLDEPPTRLQRVPPLVELLKSIAHDDEVDACSGALEMLHPEMNG